MIENHKGQQCIYKSILCQEGYCSECQIFLDAKEDKKEAALKVITRDRRIRAFLERNDPMALKQCLEALGEKEHLMYLAGITPHEMTEAEKIEEEYERLEIAEKIEEECEQLEIGEEWAKKMRETHIFIPANQKRIEDLLCGAFEGGSNYWYYITKANFPAGQTKQSLGIEFTHIELPFKGGSLTITCPEEEDGKEYILDKAACIKGLEVMASKYPRHYADWLLENDDATTADVYLQCCLFGEIVYG